MFLIDAIEGAIISGVAANHIANIFTCTVPAIVTILTLLKFNRKK